MYFPGSYIIKCMKAEGDTLSSYGVDAIFEEEIDLLDPDTSDSIRAGGYLTAENMCSDMGFELAQKIAAGEWAVVQRTLPQLDDQES